MLGQASCLTTVEGCFCESFTSTSILQPINAITSLAFVLLGIYIAIKYRNKSQKEFRYIFVLALFVTGFGSTYYHSQFDMLGQIFDFIGMYMILIAGPTFFSFKLKNIKAKVITYGALSGLALTTLLVIPDIRRYLFFVCVVILIISEILINRVSRKNFFVALGIFAFSFGIWILDNYKLACSSEIILNFHAWWHILNAIACYYLFKHYFTT